MALSARIIDDDSLAETIEQFGTKLPEGDRCSPRGRIPSARLVRRWVDMPGKVLVVVHDQPFRTNTIRGAALATTEGRVIWLVVPLADSEAVVTTLVDFMVGQYGACFGTVENADVRAAFLASPRIKSEGSHLRWR